MNAKRNLSGAKYAVYDVIQREQRSRPLSVRQILNQTGYKSTSTIHRALLSLVDDGFVIREETKHKRPSIYLAQK